MDTMGQDLTDQLNRLHDFATDLAELPLAGSGKYHSELNDRWADQARENLHYFLVLHVADLDDHWFGMIQNTISPEAWNTYNA